MQLLRSEDVHVFPFGVTRSINPTARTFSENNLTQLVRNLTDKDSYVIRHNEDMTQLDFTLYGYYFSISLANIDISGLPLFAAINTVKSETTPTEYLDGNDDSAGLFSGLILETDASVLLSNYHVLQLLDYDPITQKHFVPAASKVKFTNTSTLGIDDKIQEAINTALQIDVINCGTSTEQI